MSNSSRRHTETHTRKGKASSMKRFDGQVVIVTGAGNGIGRSHALLLAAEGAKVVVNDYGGDTAGNAGTSARAEAVVAEIRSAGGTATASAHDVSTDGAAVVATALEAFGRLDAVINNAGISPGPSSAKLDQADFERLWRVHVVGTLAVTRAAWPIFSEQKYGRIVNTSSSSVFGLPQCASYASAKAGIVGLTRTLAIDGKEHGIKVNAIMPAAATRLTSNAPEYHALLEAGFPAEKISPFTCALASEDVPVTGEIFIVGGGRAARVILGTVPGATSLDSIDTALARFDEVMSCDEITPFADGVAELLDECQRVGIDLSALAGA